LVVAIVWEGRMGVARPLIELDAGRALMAGQKEDAMDLHGRAPQSVTPVNEREQLS
jgi:hypothetical protein